jgi:hypothetical protein
LVLCKCLTSHNQNFAHVLLSLEDRPHQSLGLVGLALRLHLEVLLLLEVSRAVFGFHEVITSPLF